MSEEQEGKPRQVVHIGTTITTQFGYIDDGGNVIAFPPLRISSELFDCRFFEETFKRLSEEREKCHTLPR